MAEVLLSTGILLRRWWRWRSRRTLASMNAETHPILIAVADPTVHSEAVQVAAASGRRVVEAQSRDDIARYYLRAAAVLLDAAAALPTDLPQRPGVFFLAPEPGPVNWQLAFSYHAQESYVLPAQAADLLSELGRTLRSTHPAASIGAGFVVGVQGAAGGAGTSTLAGACARVAAGNTAQPVILVDAGESSGGTDLLFGLEESPGVRWPDIASGSGSVEADDLLRALPATADGVRVLSAGRSPIATPVELRPELIATVLGTLRQGSAQVVVDIPVAGQASDAAADHCDYVVLLVPAEVRPLAWAAQQAARLRTRGTSAAVVVRHRGWSGFSPEEIEELTGLDVLAELGTVSRLPRTIEVSGLPLHLPRSLAEVAHTIMAGEVKHAQ